MLQHLTEIVLQGKLVGVQPDALPHQEGVVVDVLAGLNLETIQQLLGDQLQHGLKLFIEQLFVPMALNGQTRKVD